MSLSNKPRIGARDFCYTVMNEAFDVIGGTPSYGTIYAVPGMVKIGVKVNGKTETLYADDVARLVADTTGKVEVSLDLADLLPDDVSRLLGHAKTNGVLAHGSNDQSPYVAIGFKILRSGFANDGVSPAFDLFWLYKGKFAKPDISADTKADGVKFQNQTLVGNFGALIANNLIRGWARTDDPAVTTAAAAAFFNQVTFPTADTSALSVVFAAGGTTKTLTATFSKASGNAANDFNMAALAAAVLAQEILVTKSVAAGAGGLCTVSWVLTTPGAGKANNTIVWTGTVTAGAAAADNVTVAVGANSGVVDNSNVAVTSVAKGYLTLA